jgi:hypothetical protein
MANNLMLIKRSTNNATPPALANGEFAYVSNGEILFIGSKGVNQPIGGIRTPGVLTANQALVVNSTSSIDKIIVANLVPTGIWANGAAGTVGQVLTANSTGGSFWQTPSGGVATVAGGAGLTSTGTTNITIDIGQGNGIIVSTDSISIQANTGLIANTSGLFINPSLSVTDMSISGNLTVLGDFVSLNVSSLSVEDALLQVAKDQASTATFTDAVDSGIYSSYGNTTQIIYTGIFRDQSDSGIYKLFSGQIPTPTTTIDTANVNFALATLQSFLKSGGLVSNSTAVTLTANSTLEVNITANSLSLSTALGVASGGTGRTTITNRALHIGNTTNGYDELAFNTTEGYVLQSNGTALIYSFLDGGTF